MKQLKNAAILLLIALGTMMVYLGFINKIIPPVLTGVGFGVIAVLFLIRSK